MTEGQLEEFAVTFIIENTKMTQPITIQSKLQRL
jgi:hypothetical protein